MCDSLKIKKMESKKILFFVIQALFFTACTSTEFNGKIVEFSDKAVEEKTIQAETISIAEYHTPLFAVYDSLIVFFNNNPASTYNYSIYNLHDKTLVGEFFSKGHGHDEFLSMSPISSFFVEDNDLKTFVYAPNEAKQMIWNVTKSINEKQAVYEKSSSYKSMDPYGAAYTNFEIIDADKILSHTSSRPCSTEEGNEEITLPAYHVHDFSNTELESFSLYNKPIYKDCEIDKTMFYDAILGVSPDRKKLVEALYFAPQINIVDLKSKKVKGFALKGSEGIFRFKQEKVPMNVFYLGVQANDKYILALYNEKDEPTGQSDVIHVFDWNGSLLQKIRLSEPVTNIFLDQKNHILYGAHAEKNEICCYNLLDIGIE